ncbi:hypothetical protein FNV43_RR21682 [Rhamnella rubrinervis]|uniref:Uncharacterized protein n=1 Tax=Rhamnella rubrinervis TaxID=2594499 RepID=A0A8K0DNU0_9ROSA|nr:hypothetical protein FNV43_RR21682 [Rhamnella rubrinervis]
MDSRMSAHASVLVNITLELSNLVATNALKGRSIDYVLLFELLYKMGQLVSMFSHLQHKRKRDLVEESSPKRLKESSDLSSNTNDEEDPEEDHKEDPEEVDGAKSSEDSEDRIDSEEFEDH